MNEQKICFIICYNNELYLSECIRYLNYLEIPDGFELDLLTIAEAESMTATSQLGSSSVNQPPVPYTAS